MRIFHILLVVIIIDLSCKKNDHMHNKEQIISEKDKNVGIDIQTANLVEQTARELIENIYYHRIDAIMQVINDDGLSNADTKIPKNEIEKELKDKSSFLYNELFREADEISLSNCKKSGNWVFSAYYFYKVNKNNYDIKITQLMPGSNYYRAIFIAKPDLNGCKTILFAPEFVIKDKKVYLASYFFSGL